MMQFYSYLYLRKDGTPYYAGKGSGNRAYDKKHPFRPPSDISRILVFPMLNEAEAFESEIALIELFGRKDNGTGCLRNLSNGGDGQSGYRHTIETRTHLRLTLQGRPKSAKTRLRMKSSWKSSQRKAAVAAKLYGNKNATGYHHTNTTKNHVSKMLKGRKISAIQVVARQEQALARFIKTVAWG